MRDLPAAFCGRWAAGCRIGSAATACCCCCWLGVGVCVARRGHAAAAAVSRSSCCSARWALLGMGNGAVFQLVPQRFPERIGLVTGIVGAAGGLGGFCCRRCSELYAITPAHMRPASSDVPRCFCAAWFCSSNWAPAGHSDGTWQQRSAPGSIPTAHRSRGSMTKARPERPNHSRLCARAVDLTQT